MSGQDLKSAYRSITQDHFPDTLEICFVQGGKRQCLQFRRVTWTIDGQERGLRYGENPDQEAGRSRAQLTQCKAGYASEVIPVTGQEDGRSLETYAGDEIVGHSDSLTRRFQEPSHLGRPPGGPLVQGQNGERREQLLHLASLRVCLGAAEKLECIYHGRRQGAHFQFESDSTDSGLPPAKAVNENVGVGNDHRHLPLRSRIDASMDSASLSSRVPSTDRASVTFSL